MGVAPVGHRRNTDPRPVPVPLRRLVRTALPVPWPDRHWEPAGRMLRRPRLDTY